MPMVLCALFLTMRLSMRLVSTHLTDYILQKTLLSKAPSLLPGAWPRAVNHADAGAARVADWDVGSTSIPGGDIGVSRWTDHAANPALWFEQQIPCADRGARIRLDAHIRQGRAGGCEGQHGWQIPPDGGY